MKKILTAILIATFFLGTGVVNAQKEEKKERSEAKNVEIKEKKLITDEQRKEMDDFEMDMIKGKPSSVVDTTTKFILPATGINATLPAGGNKYAILIGMANYPGIDYDLCVDEAKTYLNVPVEGLSLYCKDDDSFHMYDTLTNIDDDDNSEYDFSPTNIKWLRDADATYEKIKYAVLNEIKPLELTADDEVLFFFSGHGFTGESGIANDSDPDAYNEDEFIAIYDDEYLDNDLEYSGEDYLASNSMISDDEIKSWFAGSPARMTFIFDTCGAGGMNDLAGENRVLAMSSLEGQTSYTYYKGGALTDPETENYQESQGLFSHYFVNRAMEDGLGDGYNLLSKRDPNKKDGTVSIEEAFGYAYPIVKSTKPQTPVLNDRDTSFDFLP